MFPHSSIAVNVTSTEPVAPHSSLSGTALCDQITSPQSSDALAPPLFVNQVFNDDVFPAPSHCTISSTGSTSIKGDVVSWIIKLPVL